LALGGLLLLVELHRKLGAFGVLVVVDLRPGFISEKVGLPGPNSVLG